MSGQRSPVLMRQQLGVLLREYREGTGRTAADVARQLEVNASVITRLERGQRRPGILYVRALCDLYGLDKADADRLLSLARAGHESGWWERLDLRAQAAEFIGFEAGASAIDAYELGYIPGLLQTTEYARSALNSRRPRYSDSELSRLVQARMTRQQIIAGPDPVKYHALVDEGVLHRNAATPSVMRSQLEFLVEVSSMPNVTLQVLPFSAGTSLGAVGAFTVLSFSAGPVEDVAHVETPLGSIWHRDEGAARCKAIFRELAQIAASETESLHIIGEVIDTRWKA
ncbi:transcriptional regulator [Paractinoplanes deccanensis]|uniref:Transcriptional regulator n=1 Tax=Paractinoplanes deccanensis TaxID=113561 RepID=A0ABQ3YIJ8_9ACTN|nr:helix-turn-helix transcriptional regulator [Actinoplanes deccanensis]GID79821.1 transcriptional regulator [Actinoplanes deccanensis]